MASGNIIISLSGHASGAIAAINGVSQQLKNLRANFFALQEVGRILQNLGKGIVKLGVGTIGAIGGMVDAASELDDAMTRVAGLLGASRKKGDLVVSVGALRQEFIKMSNELPLSANELGNVAVALTRAGIKTEQSLKTLSLAAGKLGAIAGDLSEVEAANALVRISNNLRVVGEDASDAEARMVKLADALSRVAVIGPQTEGELANIAIRAGQGANLIGLSAQELVGFAGAVRSLGATPEVAGTALSNFFTKMAQNSEAFAKAAGLGTKEFQKLINEGDGLEATSAVLQGLALNVKKTGVDMEVLRKAFGSAADEETVTAVLNRLQKEGAASRKETIELAKAFDGLKIRGARSGRVLLGLAGNLGVLNKTLAEASDSAGSLDSVYGAFSKSFKQRIKTLQGSIENVAISFGIVLLPMLTVVVDFLLILTAAITAIPAPLKLLILLVAAFAAVLAIAVGGLVALVGFLIIGIAMIGFLVPPLKEAIKWWKTNAAAVRANSKALIANAAANAAARLGQMSSARAAVATKGFESLTIAASTLGSKFTGPGGLLSIMGTAGLAGILPALSAGFTTLVGAISLPVVAAVAAWTAFIVLFRGELMDAVKGVIDAFDGFIRIFGEIGKAFSKAFADQGGGGGLTTILKVLLLFNPVFLKIFLVVKALAIAGKFLGAVFRGIAKFAGEFFTPLAERIARFARGLREIGDRMFKMVAAFLGLEEGISIWDAITDGVANFLRNFQFLGDFIGVLADLFLGGIGGLLEGLLVSLTPLFEIFGEIGTEFIAVFSELGKAFEPLSEAFQKIGAAAGIGEEQFDLFGVSVKVVAFLLRTFLAPFVAVLKVFAFLVLGIVKVFRLFASVLAFLFRVTLSPFVNAIEAIATVFGALKTAGADVSDKLEVAFTSMAEAVEAAFQPLLDTFKEIINFPGKAADAISGFTGIKGTGSATSGGGGGAVLGSAAKAAVKLSLFANPVTAPLANIGEFAGFFARGGITSSSGGARSAVLHPNEAVIPLDKLPEVFSNMTLSGARGSSAPAQTTPSATQAIGGGGGEVSITVPVTLMLDDMILGQAIARVSKEQIRQQFGTPNVRLSGIG